MNDARVTALVADDEAVARAGLSRLLDEIDWLRVIGEAANGIDAANAIDVLKPDLVFLDIQMPGLLGTDVLRRVRHRPHVVFTTAYAQHAVTAFELGALDYLLKPFGEERLGATLERVRAAFGEPHTAFDRLGEALGRAPMTRLFVRNGRAIAPLAVSAIVRFEAVGDYIAVHAGGAPHLVHLSLGQLEERLDPSRFLRIHRAHLVNLDHVAAFRRGADGQVRAELRDGTQLPVSRAKARELRDLAR
ncbi:LytR/AlgR family response regulator transcription factor [Tahibacter soli]|uniref:LytTR family DNA-binding domain-containing protein n=1 Tax=Tahibacter soli TaxID=2983605 RepID=A0A9X3YGQ4_9GAMM|nr:LytTR family DNA-binding domain-containing protein [Tahibacter soli]MDC8011812.1 LytTR family DNA-binding domain-containing protein [Tahibacter soli]